MKNEAFRDHVLSFVEDAKIILGDKNAEYARSDDDRLANFKRRANQLGLDPLTVLQVDLFKHIDAINSYIIRYRNGVPVAVNDPIKRRALDTVVYMILFCGLLEDLGVKDEMTQTGAKEFAVIDGVSAGYSICKGAFMQVGENGQAVCSVCRLPESKHVLIR